MDKLPEFSSTCSTFLSKAESISQARALNSLTLKTHSQILEILEIPQLMDTCVRNTYYEEALQLQAHVARLQKKYKSVAVINTIAADVEHCARQMLANLLQQLQADVQLPACLRIIGYLRRLEAFTELQLRVQFLQARDSWFQKVLDAVPSADAYTYITKTVEASRVHLFDIITQYKAVFSHVTDVSQDQSSGLLAGWVLERVSKFLVMLDANLPRLTDRINSILSQCMHFALSLGRVGIDFRLLLPPLFERTIKDMFTTQVKLATSNFRETMANFVLSSHPTIGDFSNDFGLSDTPIVPLSLMAHPPLASFANDTLTAFNDLRECAPLTISDDIGAAVHEALAAVSAALRKFHDNQYHSFDQRELAQFQKLSMAFVDTLVPCMVHCVSAIYPDALFVAKASVSKESGAPGRLILVGDIAEPLIPVCPEIQAKFRAPPLVPVAIKPSESTSTVTTSTTPAATATAAAGEGSAGGDVGAQPKKPPGGTAAVDELGDGGEARGTAEATASATANDAAAAVVPAQTPADAPKLDE